MRDVRCATQRDLAAIAEFDPREGSADGAWRTRFRQGTPIGDALA